MKRFFCVFIAIFAVLSAFNSVAYAQNEIKFIYIHGTNDNNEAKKTEFTNYVNGLHKSIITEFNKSEKINKYLFEDGKYKISEEPIAFYWGAESKKDLNLLADWLDITKFFSPKIAQSVRTMIAHSFHDAIWVQKYNNMKPIIDKLHSIALEANANGDKYILLGHSAGTFITYEYFLYKLPIFDTNQLLTEKKIDNRTMQEIKKIGYRTTCADALIDSGVVVYKRDNTLYIPTDNLVENYKKLSQIEKTSCLPLNSAAGMINFGSPLSLFYSGFFENSDIYSSSEASAILNNNIFYLNLNFAEDPLGFPIIGESEYEQIFSCADNHTNYTCDLKNPSACEQKYGFIYDKSNIRSNRAVFNSHSAYWQKHKFFAKNIVKAYEEGLDLFLNNNIK